MVNNWIEVLADRLLPGLCVFCGNRADTRIDACITCLALLPDNDRACPRCALPMPAQSAAQCGRCLTDPPPVTASIAPWRYEFPLDAVIRRIKHNRRRDYLYTLSRAWLQHPAVRIGPRPDALVPVPLHWRRRFWRGFNQAEELALTIGKSMNIPVVNCTMRHRPTSPQQGLTAAQRRSNLRDAFALRRCNVAGLHLAIVDDVVTTGATTRQLAAILARGGAARVDVWALARTAPDNPPAATRRDDFHH